MDSVNSMASQIQGLKKVAAANRNKTKSQMRDSNNPTQNLNNSVQVQSSNQNNIISSQNIDMIRQSAQTALGNHGQGNLNNTQNMGQHTANSNKFDQQMNTRSSSVARLHNHLNGANGQQPVAHVGMATSQQPRQGSNPQKRGLPYVAGGAASNVVSGSINGNMGSSATSKQRYSNPRKSNQNNNDMMHQQQSQAQGVHSGQVSNAHSNYVDDNINIQDYSNSNHRKQVSNQAIVTPGAANRKTKTSIEQNNYYNFQQQQQMNPTSNTSHEQHFSTGDTQHNRKSSKSKMRHSQNINGDRQRNQPNNFNLSSTGNSGTTPGGNNHHQFVNQSQDLAGFKQSSGGPNTSMNFFKNNTQQVFLGQKSSTGQNTNTNRKSQSTGRGGLTGGRPSGGNTNVNLQQQQMNNGVNQSNQFQNGINQQIRRNNQMNASGNQNNQMGQNNNNGVQVMVEPTMKQARYASQNQMRSTGPSDITTDNPLHLNQQNSTNGLQPGSKKNLQNQSDIYKVYMNYVPSGQNSVTGAQPQMAQNQMAMGNSELNSRISPQKRSTSGNKTHAHQNQQNIVMKNRQNMLKSNKLQSNQKMSSESNSKFNNTNQSLNNLPLIQQSLQNQNQDLQQNFIGQQKSQNTAHNSQVAMINARVTNSSMVSQGSTSTKNQQMHMRRQGSARRTNSSKNTAGSNKQNIQQYMNQSNVQMPQAQMMHSSVGNMGVGQIQNSSNGGMASGPQTALYKTNTLDQYGSVGAGRNSAMNHNSGNLNAIVNTSVIAGTTTNQPQQMIGITHHQRNNTSNQSGNVMVRGMAGINLMNYSILQSELDQESTSLEDMHMFFVAFNQRQNKIIQQIEKAEMVAMANDRANLLFIDDGVALENNDDDTPIKAGKPGDKNNNSRSMPRGQKKEAGGKDGSKQPMNVILLKKEVDLE